LYSEYGNKNLKPEQTASYETGIQYYSDKFNARATGFIRNGKDVILFYTDPVSYASYYINGDKQNDYGVETEAMVKISKSFSVSANYTFVNGKVTTQEMPGKDTSYFNLYKRPKNILNLSLNYQLNKSIYLSTHFKSVSKAFEPQYQAAPYVLSSYYILDFFSRYTLNKNASFFADFQNITNQKYFVTRGFTTKGFNMNAGVQVSL
jgi:vitamin B12 transporter